MDQLYQFFYNNVLSTVISIVLFGGLSWALMFISGRPLIAWLKGRKGMKWAPREDTPDSHGKKMGTPSMGGIGIIGAALVGYFYVLCFILFMDWRRVTANMVHFSDVTGYVIFPALVGLHALLGYSDDHSKATNRGGLSSKAKLAGQIFLAIAFLALILYRRGSFGGNTTPYDSVMFESWPLMVGALLVIIGTSNAVNLTDGIDGLAAGLSVQVGAVFAVLLSEIYWAGRFSDLGKSALVFWLCLGGACLSFLAFNKFPAKVFMGDTGSLALGAALGAGTILTHSVWLLPFIGFIFFVEMFSVIIQVLYFKNTKHKFGEGKRIFRRAPLHHHFELGGWSEWRIVGTFWLVNLFTSVIGLVLWKLWILPRFP